jgi:hypothetical protein
MIQQIINTMIGSFGRAVLAFYFENQTLINVIFLIWAGTMTYASIQLSKIRHMTVRMAVDILKNDPHQSDEQIWMAFRPKWQEEVEKINAKLILNRWNFWVTKPSPEKLIEIMRLSPNWFAAIRNGEVLRYRFSLPGKNDRLSNILK